MFFCVLFFNFLFCLYQTRFCCFFLSNLDKNIKWLDYTVFHTYVYSDRTRPVCSWCIFYSFVVIIFKIKKSIQKNWDAKVRWIVFVMILKMFLLMCEKIGPSLVSPAIVQQGFPSHTKLKPTRDLPRNLPTSRCQVRSRVDLSFVRRNWF